MGGLPPDVASFVANIAAAVAAVGYLVVITVKAIKSVPKSVADASSTPAGRPTTIPPGQTDPIVVDGRLTTKVERSLESVEKLLDMHDRKDKHGRYTWDSAAVLEQQMRIRDDLADLRLLVEQTRADVRSIPSRLAKNGDSWPQ